MILERGVSDKRGQVTIFIIIAIVVVALAVLAYLFIPGLRSDVQPSSESPSQFIDTCMREKIENTVETISLHGGSFDISNKSTYFYYGDNVEYLCYTNQYYVNCVVQQPLLVQHIESEIKSEILNDASSCFQSLVESYMNDGYDVDFIEGELRIELLPERIVTTFGNEITITRGESDNYDRFNIILDSNLYQIATISSSILEWEEEYGDAPTSTYMDWYHNLKIEKDLRIDGTTVYVITDRETGDKFQFASRSGVIPPGY